ncbi:hypothetical protein [Seleniivibrio sp.]|uniref:hypothetical protein n=1 Tax=Seleniivibrio sp. TaxID=2898801 RepID=UPI0025F6D6AC|nr:hypothetical protein [Seleniivibrio sp.]MCD8554802.1 hypothetical protein [Seleniivibrio sp.]
MRFTLFLLLSLLVHILIIVNVHGLHMSKAEKPQSKIIDVEIVPPAPKVEEIQPEIPETAEADKGAAEEGQSIAGNVIPAPSATIPEIEIPKMSTEDLTKITMPKLNFNSEVKSGNSQAEESLKSEIASEAEKYHRSEKQSAGEQSTGKTAGSQDASDFFKIKNLGGNRKLVYTPEKPSFSLTSNTNVRVEFKVDRGGNTYSIVLLNRTDSNIERLAIDFVRKLKFNAVLNADAESAEITLYFRVR